MMELFLPSGGASGVSLGYLRADGAVLKSISRSVSVRRPRCQPMRRLTPSGFCRESTMLTRFICTTCKRSHIWLLLF